jgi:hypothetical protein
MRWFAVLVLALASVHVGAVELFEDGKFDAQFVRGYQLQAGDTLGGYAIFRPEAAELLESGVDHATGGQFDQLLPWIVQKYASHRGWDAIQTTGVTVGASNTSGWRGDPCSGESIAKINRVRGRLDRCAIARFKPLGSGAQMQTVLELVFVESNAGGRYYELSFLINLIGRGLALDVIADERSAQNGALKSWMTTMLDAVVLAAGLQKPANAFEGVPAPWTVLKP